jgi:hypothetical protein
MSTSPNRDDPYGVEGFVREAKNRPISPFASWPAIGDWRCRSEPRSSTAPRCSDAAVEDGASLVAGDPRVRASAVWPSASSKPLAAREALALAGPRRPAAPGFASPKTRRKTDRKKSDWLRPCTRSSAWITG